jgi:2-succinyl-6-hydroxy-2,4-cyclohexadiene-1-carboxylate synthase
MILVPGFTQTASTWDRVRASLPPQIEAHALAVPTGLDFAGTSAALGNMGGPGIYVGYSMGGRLCLRLALDRPDLVRGLVLVSASPGIADPAERADRRAADEELAASIERDGVDTFLERWLAQPLFATVPRGAAGVEDRAAGNTVASLTHALRVLGQGTQEPLWERLGELSMPVLPVAGAFDAKYRDIAQRMASAIGPDTRAAVVPNAGHAIHLEQPAVLAQLLTDFHQHFTA